MVERDATDLRLDRLVAEQQFTLWHDLVQPLFLSSALAGIPGDLFTIFPTGARSQVTTSGAVFGQASYKITDKLQLAANVRNVTNTKAINALTYDQGYYNAPRSVLATVTISY